jgi:dihydropteroate synthase/dihydroneopterin aldolase
MTDDVVGRPTDAFSADDLCPTPVWLLVMGIINVTPDSFSDGGQFLDAAAAIAQAQRLICDGAHIIDIGGESTRPGSQRVSADAEAARVLPVVEALRDSNVLLSVDTMRASLAAASIERGASIINDVSGGLADPAMLSTVAELGCDYVIQHWRGHAAGGGEPYGNVVTEVRDALLARVDAALAAGIKDAHIIIDPGIGFGKSREDDWSIVAALAKITGLGYRVLLGASRKRFLAEVSTGDAPQDRDVATAAVSLLAAQAGVWAVRVHDVQATVDALAVGARIEAVRLAAQADAQCCSARGGVDKTGVAGAGIVAVKRQQVGVQADAPLVPTNIISITGLKAKGYHGVFAHERENGQPFVVDLEIEVAAGEGDDLSETLNYATVCDEVAAIVSGEPVNLIETLADRIADAVLAHSQAKAVEVAVHKPQAPVAVPFGDIAVRTRRTKRA